MRDRSLGGPAYALGDLIRTTSRAAVYHGTRTSDGTKVVIKVLAPQHRPQDLAQLKNEYVLGVASSTATVRTLALVTQQGMPALVMEDFGGVSLDRLLGAPLETGVF